MSYAEEEDVETDQYLDDDGEEEVPAEGYYADMAYPGDPLLLSDGEDGTYMHTVDSCMSQFMCALQQCQGNGLE